MDQSMLINHLNSYNNKVYNVGIYCRLSVDDGVMLSESVSIANQKKIIEKYVEEKGWHIYDFYCDDGYSGTNFERPEFQRMLLDIEKGNINTVITKDLSRLGRNYLKTGFYLDNYFPDHNIRYIAISDNIDSINDEDDLLPFKNLINEMYAKDVSKKIRFTTQNRIKNGIDTRCSIPLYGYMYDKGNTRVINPETAPVVKMIFTYYKNGMTISDIAWELEKQKILTPMAYFHEKSGYANEPKYKYKWSQTYISNMLSDTAYLGILTRGKTVRKFKSKKVRTIPKEERYVFLNKFEPLIDEETFNECQRIKQKFINMFETRTQVPYTEICYCGICGNKLRYKNNKHVDGSDNPRLVCRTSYEPKKGTILVSDLEKVLIKELMNLKEVILSHEEEFMEKAKKCALGEIDNLKYKREVEALNAMIEKNSKIDLYIKKAFEQYSLNILPVDTYKDMMKKYKLEKEKTEADIKDLKKQIEMNKENAPDYEYEARRYVETLKSITEDNCLEKVKLTSLISKIFIKTDGIRKKRQRQNKYLDIIYYAIDPLVKEFMDADEDASEKIVKTKN